jgi:hypothetical protein
MDCGEYEDLAACEVETDVRFADRETLGLDVSEIDVVADVDDFSIGVFNILLPTNRMFSPCFMSASQR